MKYRAFVGTIRFPYGFRVLNLLGYCAGELELAGELQLDIRDGSTEYGSHYENRLQFYKISLILYYILCHLSTMFVHKDIYFKLGAILVENSEFTGSILVLM